MRLSTRGEYGVRAMVALARRRGQGPVALSEIAAGEGLSPSYLEQLLGALRRAGLVATTRGAYGGYELSRDPADITIGDVVRALEGPISVAGCVSTDASGECCARQDTCVTRTVWVKLRDSISEALDSTSLADLLSSSPNTTSVRS